jgi:hypothetical protein
VVPENRRLAQDILVAPGGKKPQPGQVVTVELIEQPTKFAQPIGKVVEVLGNYADPGMEIEIALRKRQVEPERIERLVNGIVRQLESLGDSEIHSDQIGRLVMEGLKGLDDVAYVRFASVYRNFREAKDFEAFVGELAQGEFNRADAEEGDLEKEPGREP